MTLNNQKTPDTTKHTASKHLFTPPPSVEKLMAGPPLQDPEIQQYVLIVVAFFLFVSTLGFGWLHHRNRLMPSREHRYDITELYVTSADQLCPEISKDPQRVLLEQCLQNVKLPPAPQAGPLHKVLIPRLDEIPVQSYPRLIDLFLNQGYDKLRDEFLSQKDFIVGMLVPFAYFSEDSVHVDPFTLVVAQLRRARFCYLGQCPYQFDRHSYIAVGPPLFDFHASLSKAGLSKTDMIPVWIYLSDLTSTIGVTLEHGIFVARSSHLRAARFIHGPMIQGLGFITAFTALGIALLALLFSWYRKKYVDAAAFVVLACVLYLNSLIEPYLFSFGNLPLTAQLRLAITNLGEIQVLIAASFFAWATTRPYTRLFWLSYTFAASCALIVTPLMLTALHTDILRQKMPLILGWMQFLFPTFILGLTSWKLPINPTSKSQQNLQNRKIEQGLFALTLALLGCVPLYEALQNAHGLATYPIISLRSFMLIPIFGVLFYTVFGKKRPSKSHAAISRQHEASTLIPKVSQKSGEKKSRQSQALTEIFNMIDLLTHDIRKPFSLFKSALNTLEHEAESQGTLGLPIKKLSTQIHRSLSDMDTIIHEIMRYKRFYQFQPSIGEKNISTKLYDALVDALSLVFKDKENLLFDFSFAGIADQKVIAVHQDLVISLSTLIKILIPYGVDPTDHGKLYMDWLPSQSIVKENFPKTSTATIDLSIWVRPQKKVTSTDKNFFSNIPSDNISNKMILSFQNAQKDLARFGGKIEGFESENADLMKAKLGFLIRCHGSSNLGTTTFDITPQGNTTDKDFSPHNFNTNKMWTHSSKDLLKQSNPEHFFENNIIIIDDEEIYSDAVHSLIKKHVDSRAPLSITCFKSPDEAWKHLLNTPVNLVICDIDFDHLEPKTQFLISNGIELCALIKKRYPSTITVLHTNRSLSHDHPDVIKSKADFFVVKPMTVNDLSRFMTVNDLAEENPQERHVTEKNEAKSGDHRLTNPMIIYIVDDDIFMREAWSLKLKPWETKTYASAEALIEDLKLHPEMGKTIGMIILDQYLEGGITGLEFALKIRQDETSIPANITIILATDAYDSIEKDLAKTRTIDLILPKDPIGYDQIVKKIAAKKV